MILSPYCKLQLPGKLTVVYKNAVCIKWELPPMPKDGYKWYDLYNTEPKLPQGLAIVQSYELAIADMIRNSAVKAVGAIAFALRDVSAGVATALQVGIEKFIDFCDIPSKSLYITALIYTK